MFDKTDLQTDVQRSLTSFFGDTPTIADLFSLIQKVGGNYGPGFQRCGISTNPTLFSNFDKNSSFTLRYF
jgi:hypothetical protein